MNAPHRWYHELSRYHWFVLGVAALGWMFDVMDQQLFTLARVPAIRELLAASDGTPPAAKDVDFSSGLVTAIFLVGWAVGGIAFGVLGDRIGRAKTMLWTILIYSLFTGASALAVGFWDFALYRFLTGLGIGGEFAVGVALLAEAMPDAVRPYALGALQAMASVGFIAASLVNLWLGSLEASGALASWQFSGRELHAWRLLFVVGTIPALLAILIRRRLHEPERWQAVATEAGASTELGSYHELLGDPRWRRNAIVGLLLAVSGVVGMWGIGYFSFDLFRSVFGKQFLAAGQGPQEVQANVNFWISITAILQNLGGFAGVCVFSLITPRIGRRPAFAVMFAGALVSTAATFAYLDKLSEIYWLIPLMGLFQLALFSGYAIYFPELFPTRLRSTGTSFCYNVGRFVAAAGPFTFGYLTSTVFVDQAEPMRAAGVVMCAVFLIGLLALPFAPETNGQPLPE